MDYGVPNTGDDEHEATAASDDQMAMNMAPPDDDEDMPPLVENPIPDPDEEDEGDLPMVTLSSSTSAGYTFIADPSSSSSVSSSAFAVPFSGGLGGENREVGGVEGKIKFDSEDPQIRPPVSLLPPLDDDEAQGTEGGHIPRPPNAFILFRSSFIRSQRISGKVEGNHSTLSKIIGKYWRQLPPSERAEWEAKAKIAQAEHRERYPDWRFRMNGSGSSGGGRSRGRGSGRRGRGRLKAIGNRDDGGGKDKEVDGEETANERTPKASKGKGKAKAIPQDSPVPYRSRKGSLRTRNPVPRTPIAGTSASTSASSSSSGDRRIQRITELLIQGMEGPGLEREMQRWEQQEAFGSSSSAREPTPLLEDAHLPLPDSISTPPAPAERVSPASDASRGTVNTSSIIPPTLESAVVSWNSSPTSATYTPNAANISTSSDHSEAQGTSTRSALSNPSTSLHAPTPSSPHRSSPSRNTTPRHSISFSYIGPDLNDEDSDGDTQRARGGSDWFFGIGPSAGESPASSGSYASASPERMEPCPESSFDLGAAAFRRGRAPIVGADAYVEVPPTTGSYSDSDLSAPPLARSSSAPAPIRLDPGAVARALPIQFTSSTLPSTPQSPPPASPYPDETGWGHRPPMYPHSSSTPILQVQTTGTPHSPQPLPSPFLSSAGAIPPPHSPYPASPHSQSPLSPVPSSSLRSPLERPFGYSYTPHHSNSYPQPQHHHQTRRTSLLHRQSIPNFQPHRTRHSRSRSTAHEPAPPSSIYRRRGSIALPISSSPSLSESHTPAFPWQTVEAERRESLSVWEAGHEMPITNSQPPEMGWRSTTSSHTPETWASDTDLNSTSNTRFAPLTVGVGRTIVDPYLIQEQQDPYEESEEPRFSTYSSLSGWAGEGVPVGEEVQRIAVHEVPKAGEIVRAGERVEPAGWTPEMLNQDWPKSQ